ncbi:hypothetical protein FHS43_002901 [Streptosporangium becharense]|uniref:DUF4082 domain-containing protein n=1 Tax=Streptosporangium becharense TaxID=1816182 RepID=A0A7W9MJI7_9ACTN|nr:DUF4082 domain-containing protein [Streptosporangium becharense]MBB2911628.1 hypothetical protein [Streptosporangium becharense]MBB5822554.1 hypothetical protein [Streptosporangium becharense]
MAVLAAAGLLGPGQLPRDLTGGITAGTAEAAAGRAALACPAESVICQENSLPGNPPSEWDIPGAGSPDILGYTAQMSVNVGQTVDFKVNTPASDYRVDIYRIGYYGGMGARKITTVEPSVPLPQEQAACRREAETGLVDCGTWAVSASWAVPADAVSGVYSAKLVREDGVAGASQILFVVRDDARNADLLFQTSDATWQAYNTYGGNSLYSGSPAGRAFKVSYNRPVLTRAGTIGGSRESYFFNSEYPMVRWLEANGYDVSYTSNIDTASRPAQLLGHRAFLSVGHDEYWSREMRENAEAARDSGVNMAFFSANEVFWKTRWENSIDDQNTPFRTLVCYKETLANAKIDPSPQWTGTWRDPRFVPPPEGGRPENALTGTLFRINGTVADAMVVSSEFAPMRLWRYTSVANLQPGETAVFPSGILGYEWDEAPDTEFSPPGLVRYSRTVIGRMTRYLLNFGNAYGPGVATHNLSLYKHSSGAIVFGTGTTQWSWALDPVHDRAGMPTDIRAQQATVNIFADMGAQPATLQPGLIPASASPDTSRPASVIDTPSPNASVPSGTTISVEGTANDTGGGVVAAVEVSFDGGNRWFQAKGRTRWQYSWTTGAAGQVTIMSRAVDDSGNVQGTPNERIVTVVAACPCTLWPASTTPALASGGDPAAVEVGVKFQATRPGHISGIRFYKGVQNTGTHVGNLWTASGQLLATATFTNETASGWQQVNFATPVPVSSDTTYVASYHAPNGNYSITRPYFTRSHGSGVLTAPSSGSSGGNGVYRYGAASGFPTASFKSTNYWVDVVFTPSSTLWDDTDEPAIEDTGDTRATVVGLKFQAIADGVVTGVRFYKAPLNTGPHVGSLWTAGGQLLRSATAVGETASGWQQVNFDTPVPVTAGTTYVASYHMKSGRYSATRPYFTARYVRDPLLALADGEQGGNGVYRYSSSNAFPTNTYQSTNYWVDVLFNRNPS